MQSVIALQCSRTDDSVVLDVNVFLVAVAQPELSYYGENYHSGWVYE